MSLLGSNRAIEHMLRSDPGQESQGRICLCTRVAAQSGQKITIEYLCALLTSIGDFEYCTELCPNRASSLGLVSQKVPRSGRGRR